MPPKTTEEMFGPKCDTYEEDCYTCMAYKAIEEAYGEGFEDGLAAADGIHSDTK